MIPRLFLYSIIEQKPGLTTKNVVAGRLWFLMREIFKEAGNGEWPLSNRIHWTIALAILLLERGSGFSCLALLLRASCTVHATAQLT